MGKVLVLASIPPLTKKEEQDLTDAGHQLTQLLRYSLYNEYLIKTGQLDYDVIVVDDSLSFVDVYESCRQLHLTSKAKIILLGERPCKEMAARAKEIGLDFYYQKPVQPNELVGRIKHTLNGIKTMPLPPESPAKKPLAVLDEIVTNMEINVIKSHSPEPVPTAKTPDAAVSQPAPDLPVAKNSAPRVLAAQPAPGLPATQNSTTNIWQDPKVSNLINGFLKGKIKQLKASINLGFGEGFSYPEAEEIMGVSTKEAVVILESLAKQELLVKKNFEKIMAAPNGSMQLVPVEKCPTCDSSDLIRGQLVEHFTCGFIGLEDEFLHGMDQVCPKCHRELKLIGTDYRKPGMRYICKSCRGIFPTPVVKSRCLKTGEIFNLEDMHYVSIYTYELNEAYRKKLEFELEPKKQLIDYLARLGYDVQESVQIQGRSGANHKFDIVATMDDLITRHSVAIGILAAPQDDLDVTIDPLFNFDSKVYDTGIDSKMVIAVPRFAPEAMKFADRQGIRVYDLEDLKSLLSWKNQLTQTVAINQTQPINVTNAKPVDIAFDEANPRIWLRNLLENRGYSVEENLNVVGRSGADHVLDLYARKDDGIIDHKVAACIITEKELLNGDVNTVMQFDTAAYDVNIRDKVLISVPALSKEARQFAEYQRIKIIEAKDLRGFMTFTTADRVVSEYNVLANKQ